jgi:hypothetical protein
MLWPSFSNPPFHVHGIGRGGKEILAIVLAAWWTMTPPTTELKALTLPDEYIYLARPPTSPILQFFDPLCKSRASLPAPSHPISWTLN